MYACIAGSSPQAANERYKSDTLAPAMLRWEGEYSDRLLEIIDWCLNLNHFYRPQASARIAEGAGRDSAATVPRNPQLAQPLCRQCKKD